MENDKNNFTLEKMKIAERLTRVEEQLKGLKEHFTNHLSHHKAIYWFLALILASILSLWIKRI